MSRHRSVSTTAFRISLSLALRDTMANKGITTKELSDKTKIAHQTIKAYWHGEAIPSLHSAALISTVLGITVDSLMDKKQLDLRGL